MQELEALTKRVSALEAIIFEKPNRKEKETELLNRNRIAWANLNDEFTYSGEYILTFVSVKEICDFVGFDDQSVRNYIGRKFSAVGIASTVKKVKGNALRGYMLARRLKA